MVKQLLGCVPIVACGASTPPGAVAGALAHTFSIVARDAATGEIGVAVARIQALAPSRTPRRR